MPIDQQRTAQPIRFPILQRGDAAVGVPAPHETIDRPDQRVVTFDTGPERLQRFVILGDVERNAQYFGGLTHFVEQYLGLVVHPTQPAIWLDDAKFTIERQAVEQHVTDVAPQGAIVWMDSPIELLNRRSNRAGIQSQQLVEAAGPVHLSRKNIIIPNPRRKFLFEKSKRIRCSEVTLEWNQFEISSATIPISIKIAQSTESRTRISTGD